MRTISDAIGRGPINISYIKDEKGLDTTWEIRRPVGRKRSEDITQSVVDFLIAANDEAPPPPVERVVKLNKRRSVGTCGFITSCYPRSNGTNLGARLLLGDPAAMPANENVYSARWPVKEEYIAHRLGRTEIENDAAWAAVDYIGSFWNSFSETVEPYLAPGTRRYSGGSRTPTVGDLSLLRGQEVYADIFGRFRLLNKRTNGGFSIVKMAVVDACEMRELAGEIRNVAKRAALGRARLIAALPIVAKEIRLLDIADAA